MKKFNDTKLYFWFSACTLALALILGAVSFYSILIVEPKAVKQLTAGFDDFKSSIAEGKKDDERKKLSDSSSEKFKNAYLLLRSPQVFARYENFDRYDRVSDSVKNTIAYFDARVYDKAVITGQEALYLNILLDRRQLGSRLGRSTFVFFMFVSLIGWAFYFYEKRSILKKQP